MVLSGRFPANQSVSSNFRDVGKTTIASDHGFCGQASRLIAWRFEKVDKGRGRAWIMVSGKEWEDAVRVGVCRGGSIKTLSKLLRHPPRWPVEWLQVASLTCMTGCENQILGSEGPVAIVSSRA